MQTLYPTQLSRIEEIISEARTGEELFFTDSKQAAKDILQFLHDSDMIKGKVVPMVIDNDKCMVI